ncbi:hypothetical protein AS25_11235 [Kocuria marina]|uniref:Dihydrolipoamide acetyltransferase component of pyruvate dehydrogenase complex n=1 Tax=Kocuria marina TaxID=223184 RepID=A0A0B0D8H4_9MICC|nr:dihydrolipoamide acetyltransferase family protein [Kocuria marina]KHE73718.1 hypothetical protein AS25_11235 [Kocuria marina]
MSTVQFKLPDVGEGLTEADILTWKVAAGDSVKVNQVIVEIETAKSVVELPCPTAGSVAALLAPEGATVEVGTPIIDILSDDAAAAGSAGAPAAPAGSEGSPDSRPGAEATGDADGSGATLVGYGAREDTKRRGRLGRPRALAEQRAAEPAGPAPSGPTGLLEDAGAPQRPDPSVPSPADTRARAKPPVRKRAKDSGVDLARVTGTGPAGEVTRRDLEQHLAAAGGLPEVTPTTPRTGHTLAAPLAGPTTPLAAPEDDETWTIPLKGVRKATAQAMVASAFTAPHVTEFLDVDVTRTMELVARSRGTEGYAQVNPLAVLSRAVCWALHRTPELNASLQGEQITVSRRVHLGIATATDRGLMVPVVPDAHAMSVGELARRIREVAATAREGRCPPEAMRGGSITITNVGVFGVDSGTPILNPGQTAIVAFGQIRKRPWVVDDELVVRQVATLSVSADHRVVDGAEISRFLADVGAAMEDPSLMLV